jgi:hypothetical protein
MISNEEKSGALRPGGGLRLAELTPGAFVTVSENKRISDRSLVEALWQIIAINEAHVALRFRAGIRPIDPEFETRIVPLHEHDFYRADHLADALIAASKPPSANIVRIRDG